MFACSFVGFNCWLVMILGGLLIVLGLLLLFHSMHS